MNKIGVINLGCSKNLVDAENLISHLVKAGYETADDYQEADVVIINTCGFINEAIQESLETIQDAMQHHGKVIVTGCLGVRRKFILEKFPNVIHVAGPGNFAEVLAVVKKILPLQTKARVDDSLIKLTPKHYAYLKIAEGCSHKCSYCIIPQLRGSLKSRSMDEILFEAEKLVKQGAKELIIIAQDAGSYGIDLGLNNGIFSLLEKLSQFGIWIRLHYLYPYVFVDDIVGMMSEKKILPYLDVPFQHVSENILQQMQRPGSTEKTLARINSWRKICPEIAIRSTFLVGFPGETESEFYELLEFLRAAKLDRVGAFKYSPVEGARANQFPRQVSEEIKEERLNELMSLQVQISAENLAKKVGTEMEVIVDEISEEYLISRSKYDSVAVDGNVFVNAKGKVGEIINVKITDSDDHDLWGVA